MELEIKGGDGKELGLKDGWRRYRCIRYREEKAQERPRERERMERLGNGES